MLVEADVPPSINADCHEPPWPEDPPPPGDNSASCLVNTWLCDLLPVAGAPCPVSIVSDKPSAGVERDTCMVLTLAGPGGHVNTPDVAGPG